MRSRLLVLLLLGCDAPCGEKGEACDTGEPDSQEPDDTAETDSPPVDEDGDGFDATADCDDADPDIYPGAMERCDGQDDDCDPATLEDGRVTYEDASGVYTDLSADFAIGAEGAPVAIAARSGTYTLCAGTYSTRWTLTNEEVRIKGLDGSASTTLDGGGLGSVIAVIGDAAALTLEGLTLQNGVADRVNSLSYTSGGGLTCLGDGATVTGSDLVITGNEAETGGGLFAEGCVVDLARATFSQNSATWGGAVQALSGEITLTQALIQDNQAASVGGGIELEGYLASVSIALMDSVVRDNSADIGGGIALSFSAAARCEGTGAAEAGVYRNTATNPVFGGGGVLIASGDVGAPTLEVSGCDFGADATDNSPDDVWILDEDRSYTDYGADATFTCDHVSCG